MLAPRYNQGLKGAEGNSPLRVLHSPTLDHHLATPSKGGDEYMQDIVKAVTAVLGADQVTPDKVQGRFIPPLLPPCLASSISSGPDQALPLGVVTSTMKGGQWPSTRPTVGGPALI